MPPEEEHARYKTGTCTGFVDVVECSCCIDQQDVRIKNFTLKRQMSKTKSSSKFDYTYGITRAKRKDGTENSKSHERFDDRHIVKSSERLKNDVDATGFQGNKQDDTQKILSESVQAFAKKSGVDISSVLLNVNDKQIRKKENANRKLKGNYFEEDRNITGIDKCKGQKEMNKECDAVKNEEREIKYEHVKDKDRKTEHELSKDRERNKIAENKTGSNKTLKGHKEHSKENPTSENMYSYRTLNPELQVDSLTKNEDTLKINKKTRQKKTNVWHCDISIYDEHKKGYDRIDEGICTSKDEFPIDDETNMEKNKKTFTYKKNNKIHVKVDQNQNTVQHGEWDTSEKKREIRTKRESFPSEGTFADVHVAGKHIECEKDQKKSKRKGKERVRGRYVVMKSKLCSFLYTTDLHEETINIMEKGIFYKANPEESCRMRTRDSGSPRRDGYKNSRSCNSVKNKDGSRTFHNQNANGKISKKNGSRRTVSRVEHDEAPEKSSFIPITETPRNKLKRKTSKRSHRKLDKDKAKCSVWSLDASEVKPLAYTYEIMKRLRMKLPIASQCVYSDDEEQSHILKLVQTEIQTKYKQTIVTKQDTMNKRQKGNTESKNERKIQSKLTGDNKIRKSDNKRRKRSSKRHQNVEETITKVAEYLKNLENVQFYDDDDDRKNESPANDDIHVVDTVLAENPEIAGNSTCRRQPEASLDDVTEHNAADDFQTSVVCIKDIGVKEKPFNENTTRKVFSDIPSKKDRKKLVKVGGGWADVDYYYKRHSPIKRFEFNQSHVSTGKTFLAFQSHYKYPPKTKSSEKKVKEPTHMKSKSDKNVTWRKEE